VRATSLGGNGPYSDFHFFRIESPHNLESPHDSIVVVIVFVIFFFTIVLVAVIILYYFKHQILTILNRQGDSQNLIEVDFNQISRRYLSRDQLSDIAENDE
jgi:predicted PurR-regulated permease PerM